MDHYVFSPFNFWCNRCYISGAIYSRSSLSGIYRIIRIGASRGTKPTRTISSTSQLMSRDGMKFQSGLLSQIPKKNKNDDTPRISDTVWSTINDIKTKIRFVSALYHVWTTELKKMDQIRSSNRRFRKNSPFNREQAPFILTKYEQSKCDQGGPKSIQKRILPKEPTWNFEYPCIHKNYSTF